MLALQEHLGSIADSLTYICGRISIDSSINLHDSSVISEDFFCRFLNLAFGWNLVNANALVQNMPGFDLIDEQSRILVQVTSTSTRKRIQTTLDNEVFADYGGYHMIFMLLVDKKPRYDRKEFDNPHELDFDAKRDIWDISDLVAKIKSIPGIAIIEELDDLVKREVGPCLRTSRRPYLLAEVVKALVYAADSGLNIVDDAPVVVGIDEKISRNRLEPLREVIVEAAPYTWELDKLFDQYSKDGTVKVMQLLSSLTTIYQKANLADADSGKVFYAILDTMVRRIEDDGRLPRDISREELEWGAKVVLVDAFARCRVFKGPDLKGQGVDRMIYAAD